MDRSDIIEERIVDPVTGGAKGVKPARFDLIPPVEFIEMCGAVTAEPAPARTGAVITGMLSWWGGGESKKLRVCGSLGMSILLRDLTGQDDNTSPAAWHLAEVYGYGAKKYEDKDNPVTSDYNWARGYRWGYSYGAAMRHLWLRHGGEIVDAESNHHHMAHFVWHTLTLSYFINNNIGVDDRLVTLRKGKQ